MLRPNINLPDYPGGNPGLRGYPVQDWQTWWGCRRHAATVVGWCARQTGSMSRSASPIRFPRD